MSPGPSAMCLVGRQREARVLGGQQASSAGFQRLTANPSVKGTSCGRPQAAPYVER